MVLSIQGKNCQKFKLLIVKISSLKHPAKYVGRKPRKYTVPVPVAGSGEASASLTGKTHIGDHHQLNFYPLFSGNVASSSLAARASGRGRPQGVDPLAAQVSRLYESLQWFLLVEFDHMGAFLSA